MEEAHCFQHTTHKMEAQSWASQQRAQWDTPMARLAQL